MNTKEKILAKAKELYNDKGYHNITVVDIARELGMSRGNLTYHFKNSEEILEALVNQLWDNLQKERQTLRQFPSFENIKKEINVFHSLQQDYAFVFLDTNVMNYLSIKEKLQEVAKQFIAENKAAISFSIQLKNMHPERVPGTYNNIAYLVWMASFYWFMQGTMGTKKNIETLEKMMWSILIPHFTDKGIKAFKDFYGEEYFNQLGDAFDFDMSSLMTF